MRKPVICLAALLLAALAPCVWAEDAPAGPVTSYMTTVTVDPLGEATARISTRPANYLGADGRFTPIDTAVVATDTGFVNRTNTLTTEIANTYDQGWSVDLGGAVVRFTPVAMGSTTASGFAPHALPSPAQGLVGGTPDTVVFTETYPGVADELVIRGGEIEHTTVVSRRESVPTTGGALSFVYRMTVSEGLTVNAHPLEITTTEEGGIVSMPYVEIQDATGKTVAFVPTPHLYDSSEHAVTASGDMSYTTLSATEGLLTVKVQEGLLDRMTFPVRIDPQLVQVLNVVNPYSGSAWGHFEFGTSTYAVRFNGSWEVGTNLAYFGPPFDYQYVVDCVSTPVFDLKGIPTLITHAELSYMVLIDSYGGLEQVVLNDHKSDATSSILGFLVFANNMADGRNSGPFVDRTPDFTKDKTYNHCDLFSDNTSYHLTGRALHDIHQSQRGVVDTVSEYPLPAGLFAVAVHDTSEYRFTYELYLYNFQLTVRYQQKGNNP